MKTLLRKSKIATFLPEIDQVYTTTASAYSKNSFGLKRSLPSSNERAPFIRIKSLDNSQGRTEYRQASRESIFVKKWEQAAARITTTTSGLDDSLNQLPVLSRFAPSFNQSKEAIPGLQAIQESEALESESPNIFEMSDRQFEDFLSSLGKHREKFLKFLKARHEADPSTGRATLIEAVDEFFKENLPAESRPFPHPLLALTYSTPSQIETMFNEPVPARILGRSPIYNSFRNSFTTSILGMVTTTMQQINTVPTAFYPDRDGVRSNEPGRIKVQPTLTIDRAAFYKSTNSNPEKTNDQGYVRYDFQNGWISPHGPMALQKAQPLMKVTTTTSTPVTPGSMAYVKQPVIRKTTSCQPYLRRPLISLQNPENQKSPADLPKLLEDWNKC